MVSLEKLGVVLGGKGLNNLRLVVHDMRSMWYVVGLRGVLLSYGNCFPNSVAWPSFSEQWQGRVASTVPEICCQSKCV